MTGFGQIHVCCLRDTKGDPMTGYMNLLMFMGNEHALS